MVAVKGLDPCEYMDVALDRANLFAWKFRVDDPSEVESQALLILVQEAPRWDPEKGSDPTDFIAITVWLRLKDWLRNERGRHASSAKRQAGLILSLDEDYGEDWTLGHLLECRDEDVPGHLLERRDWMASVLLEVDAIARHEGVPRNAGGLSRDWERATDAFLQWLTGDTYTVIAGRMGVTESRICQVLRGYREYLQERVGAMEALADAV